MTDAEIVKAVAEKVMRFHQSETVQGTQWVDGAGLCRGNVLLNEWDPLNNDADACAVLDKMVDRGYCVELKRKVYGEWLCVMYHVDIGAEFGHRDQHRCRAICLAALAAIENEVTADEHVRDEAAREEEVMEGGGE